MEITSIQLYCVFAVGLGHLDRVKQFLISEVKMKCGELIVRLLYLVKELGKVRLLYLIKELGKVRLLYLVK